MKSEKVFLRIDTPFSLKNPKTLQMVCYMGSVILMCPLLMLWLYNSGPANRELAERLSVFFVLWAVMGAIPTVLLVFNSYAMVVDEELICNNLGFLPKRYPRECLSKAVRKGSRIEIYADTKRIVSMPDNQAAKQLVAMLRLPL